MVRARRPRPRHGRSALRSRRNDALLLRGSGDPPDFDLPWRMTVKTSRPREGRRATMPRMSPARWLLPILVAVSASGQAQEPPAANPAKNNPHLGNGEAIRSGMTMYRVRCADCHGLDAKGYRGPDLTALLAGGDMTDERLFNTIRKGVPGTDMPPSQ